MASNELPPNSFEFAPAPEPRSLDVLQSYNELFKDSLYVMREPHLEYRRPEPGDLLADARQIVDKLIGQPLVGSYAGRNYYLENQQGDISLQQIPPGFKWPTIRGILAGIESADSLAVVEGEPDTPLLAVDPMMSSKDPDVLAFYGQEHWNANKMSQPLGLNHNRDMRLWLPVSSLSPDVGIDTGYLMRDVRLKAGLQTVIRRGFTHEQSPEIED